MKKTLFLGLVCAAVAAFGGNYRDWYTPAGGFSTEKASCAITVAGQNIQFDVYSTTDLAGCYDLVNDAATDVPASAKNAFELSKAALANSMYAVCQNKMSATKIDQLASAIEGIFVQTYGQYQDSNGNVISKTKSGIDTSKLRAQMIANKNAIYGGGRAAGSSESNPLKIIITQKPYDERQFEQHVESGSGKSLTSLKGYYNLTGSESGLGGADGWAFETKDYYIPFTDSKNNNLGWKRWNGLDENIFDASKGGNVNDKPLHLKGWYNPSGCAASMQNVLTNVNNTSDRQKHYVLTRYGDANAANPELHWMKFDAEPMSIGGGGNPDGDSIVLEDKEFEEGQELALNGYKDAKTAAGEEEDGEPHIPYTDGGNGLAWKGIADFFSSKVFDKTSDGKMILHGISDEGSDKVRILAVKGTDTNQEVSTIQFDNASVDGDIENVGQVIQMHAFNAAPNPYQGGNNFADALTNTATTIAGMSVPVRYNSGSKFEIGYIPMGKVTGIPAAAVDDKTIEVNKEDPQNQFLQLYGAAGEGITLEDGQVYSIKDGKGKFVNITGENEGAGGWAHPSLEETEDANGNICLSLYNWNNTIEGAGLLGWNSEHELSYWEADDFGGLSIDDDKTLAIDGYFDASVNAIPYKKQSTGQADGIGWINLPENRVIIGASGNNPPTGAALGLSLDKQNVSAVPTINVAGFTAGGGCSATLSSMMTSDSLNRGRHQLMARYSTGSGNPDVHWVSLGDAIGGGAACDDKSITTNTTHGAVTSGNASLFGFSSASAGQYPVKGDNGALTWVSTNSVSTIASAFGWNGTSVTDGYYQFGRRFFYVSGFTPSASTTGYLILTVTHPTTYGGPPYAVMSITTSSSDFITQTDTTTKIPLYYFNNGKPTVDYRFHPIVPAFD